MDLLRLELKLSAMSDIRMIRVCYNCRQPPKLRKDEQGHLRLECEYCKWDDNLVMSSIPVETDLQAETELSHMVALWNGYN